MLVCIEDKCGLDDVSEPVPFNEFNMLLDSLSTAVIIDELDELDGLDELLTRLAALGFEVDPVIGFEVVTGLETIAGVDTTAGVVGLATTAGVDVVGVIAGLVVTPSDAASDAVFDVELTVGVVDAVCILCNAFVAAAKSAALVVAETLAPNESDMLFCAVCKAVSAAVLVEGVALIALAMSACTDDMCTSPLVNEPVPAKAFFMLLVTVLFIELVDEVLGVTIVVGFAGVVGVVGVEVVGVTAGVTTVVVPFAAAI